MDIEIRVAEKNNIKIINCSGHVDSDTFGELKKTIIDLLDGGHCRIIIDMSKITFMSSAGWGVIVGYLKEARRDCGDIVLAALSEHAKAEFLLANFDYIIKAFDTTDKALVYFEKKEK